MRETLQKLMTIDYNKVSYASEVVSFWGRLKEQKKILTVRF